MTMNSINYLPAGVALAVAFAAASALAFWLSATTWMTFMGRMSSLLASAFSCKSPTLACSLKSFGVSTYIVF